LPQAQIGRWQSLVKPSVKPRIVR